MIRAKLLVPVGGSPHCKGGEMLCPSQLYCFWIGCCEAKAGLVSFMVCAAPPDGAGVGEPESQADKISTSIIRLDTLPFKTLPEAILISHHSFPYGLLLLVPLKHKMGLPKAHFVHVRCASAIRSG